MRFDLKQFFKTGREPLCNEFPLDLAGRDFPGYTVPRPVLARFEAAPCAQGVQLELLVEGEVCAPCARCLAPARQGVRVCRGWLVRQSDLAGEELELPLDSGGVLDVDELIFQELVLEVEPVLLCSPDCQGLCPVCGTPKAAGCTCCKAEDAAPADARLSILKQLLH